MTREDPSEYPNRNTLWAETLVDELVAGGLSAVCIAPGSRSTPLTVAFATHDDVQVFSHLDERSAAFFALGRGRRTGEPTALVCTSGTAAANFHPAVIEASQARVPLLVLTADRPPELRDSGANQTIDQEKLYGNAVRWYRDLPEPEATPRKLRRLRTDAARAIAEAAGTPMGPVHLNCPFRKPLEPVEVAGDVPDDWDEGDTRASAGRPDGPYVDRLQGRPTLADSDLATLASAVDAAETGLILAGPADSAAADDARPEAIATLARETDFPVLADPLSGLRFGPHVADTPVLGGYDGYLSALDLDPDLVLRFGASMTSKPVRKALAQSGARQVLVDPAGEWRDAEFVCSDLVVADPGETARALADAVESPGAPAFRDRLLDVESSYWSLLADERDHGSLEGSVLGTVFAAAPDPATVFVSNSMPIRDADRFGRPREADLTVLANRGASGIDGILSTGLGAGSATDDELVVVLGDLAYYHDMNGLLALSRCDVDATIVCINNDGGGIFHLLPIEEFDPPFTEQFKTPHGLDFEPTGELYDLDFRRVAPGKFESAYKDALGSDGTTVVEVGFDSEANHRERERVREAVVDQL
ncbi:2-succinyl-5-enolpyruvyl-6-hydroxy-3-cyclohexene-1-carboxylic-acid synthase [Haloarchaeobius sp. HME9146]|uniref:2-succinyl-5-enolpyruvyl-6-hydroxy-3- cyclohexene-1-carboxylic-acid synthase n=1 Tax=Haloarchaeobius sp. HME9146 TaxID=2978732 RepID=UPI0021BEEDC1|nr:2-succinyl-5-enolpyruvyl-6-hydroxy-3-cyclohexene-1-carboxylic-acid synthase [Haloarchaeobius sp. HME9146]MCT9096364.1 2-succinyl-5-enolpyruvyl-6-hydroxy-3-cyclohexene-1-carboxylic-acid synthase [Haloarchaeobius sp. HME9146]